MTWKFLRTGSRVLPFYLTETPHPLKSFANLIFKPLKPYINIYREKKVQFRVTSPLHQIFQQFNELRKISQTL